MATGKPLKAEDHAKIAELSAGGADGDEIARKLGITKSTVYRSLNMRKRAPRPEVAARVSTNGHEASAGAGANELLLSYAVQQVEQGTKLIRQLLLDGGARGRR